MVGPLWGFFLQVKDKSSIPVSIDQYFAFVQLINHETFRSLQSREDLLQLMKICWLNDIGFEDQFVALFNRYFDDVHLWEIKPRGKKESEKISGDPAPVRQAEDDQQMEKQEKAEDEVEEGKSTPDTGVNHGNQAELELVLSDASLPDTGESGFERGNGHSFALSDKSIMPFNARKFAQRLRRKVETAEQAVSERINIPEMVRRYIEQGFIDEIVFELEDASYSNIVLFSDRYGSMLAYDYLVTQFHESLRNIPHCHFEHYEFYNLPKNTEDLRGYTLTPFNRKNRPIDSRINSWSNKTWFFILSDAGGHSGLVNKGRIIATNRFWGYLKSISEYVFWINPVPGEYLNDCTARRLQMRIPMVPPEMEPLNELIKKARAVG